MLPLVVACTPRAVALDTGRHIAAIGEGFAENAKAIDTFGNDNGKGMSKFSLRRQRFAHRLRVCNAYPNVPELDVYLTRLRAEKLTINGPMKYTACADFRTPLMPHDKIEFRAGTTSAGFFAVADLPNNDALLLLVIHRHDTLTSAVSFESHVFANLLNSQIAIIDTYKGKSRAKAFIMHPGAENQRETLRFNSVVAVNSGQYAVKFETDVGNLTHDLVALSRSSYVVLRVGAENEYGGLFGENIVVFPNSDPNLLHSSASFERVNLAVYVAVAISTVVFGARV